MYIPVEIATLERVNQSLKRPDSTTVNIVPVQGDKLSAVSWYMSKHVPYIYYSTGQTGLPGIEHQPFFQ